MKTIHYSQCWEDPKILTDALKIGPKDNVISIASAGDNTFALLLQNPKSITAIDCNPLQIFLIELKMKAIELLEYNDFVSFVGAHPCGNRLELYNQLANQLTKDTREFWDNQKENIIKGIIHCGKFESYFNIFRRFVMPFIHPKRRIKQLLSASTLEEQQKFYDSIWNNWRWRFLFRIFFGKFLLGHLGRHPSFFQYVSLDKIANELFTRSRHGLTGIPIQNNFFLEYIFWGKYSNLKNVHPYLSEPNFQFLKHNIGKLRLVKTSFYDYIRTLHPNTVNKFNLSDIFEYMSEAEFNETWKEIERISKNNSSVAFWTLFIPRSLPDEPAQNFQLGQGFDKRISNSDRGFFYGGFCHWLINGSTNNDSEEFLNHKYEVSENEYV